MVNEKLCPIAFVFNPLNSLRCQEVFGHSFSNISRESSLTCVVYHLKGVYCLRSRRQIIGVYVGRRNISDHIKLIFMAHVVYQHLDVMRRHTGN